MDEEVDKIPEFFEYAGSQYHYIVLDISNFLRCSNLGKEILQVFFICGMVIF